MKNNSNSERRLVVRKVAKQAPKRSRLLLAKGGSASSKKYLLSIDKIYNQEQEDIDNFAAFARKKVASCVK